VAALAHWLGAGALDGTLFAICAWLASVTLLRRSTGRVLSLLWLSVLVGFVLVRPFQVQGVPRLPPYRVVDAVRTHALEPSDAWLAYGYAAVVLLLLSRLVLRQRQLWR
jgi:hypothetical protein